MGVAYAELDHILVARPCCGPADSVVALECHLSVTRSSVFAAFWWTKRWW